MMLIKRFNPIKNKEVEMELDITPVQYAMWEDGMLVQDAFPNLTPDEREFILTGLLPSEWEELLGKKEE